MSKHKQNMQRRSSMGKGLGLGLGYHGNTKLPALQPADLPLEFALRMAPNTQAYRLGQCSVITSPPYMSRGWHMSIAHRSRYPTWDEIAAAWYGTVPDADNRIACMVLPPKAEYINLHNFCFQIHELQKDESGLVRLEGGL